MPEENQNPDQAQPEQVQEQQTQEQQSQQSQEQQTPSTESTGGKTYKIVYDRDGCIGAGACVTANPDNWVMAEDNKANFKKETITEEELEKNMDAAKVCPVNVIHIEDQDGKRLI